MKKPVAALTSFMASEDDAAPARFSEAPEVRTTIGRPPKPAAERNDAQIVLKVPEAFEREFKSYAAAHGKKLNQFVMQLFRDHLAQEKSKG